MISTSSTSPTAAPKRWKGALKTARKFTGRTRLVAFDGAFHGDTFGALSVGGNPIYRQPFEPLLPGVEFLPFDDAAALPRIDDSVAAVIIEPVQGEGGVRIPGDGFLPALRRRCDEVGALLIADEVITGFGRTGQLFACEHWDIVPDILVLAKALGGGMPLGAFVGRAAVMQTLSHDPPLAHVTTFGGHPVCCAAGLAALDVLVNERLSERAARVGAEWLAQLHGVDRRRAARRARQGLADGVGIRHPRGDAPLRDALLRAGADPQLDAAPRHRRASRAAADDRRRRDRARHRDHGRRGRLTRNGLLRARQPGGLSVITSRNRCWSRSTVSSDGGGIHPRSTSAPLTAVAITRSPRVLW